LVGATFELKEFPENEVLKGKHAMKQKLLDLEKAKIVYPPTPVELPLMTEQELKQKVQQGLGLVIVENLVHDVTQFIKDHPGGEFLLKSAIGQDATARFNGTTGVYKHSNAARNLLSTFRVARFQGVIGNNNANNLPEETDKQP